MLVFASDYQHDIHITNEASSIVLSKECPQPFGKVRITIVTNPAPNVCAISNINIYSRWGSTDIPSRYFSDLTNAHIPEANFIVTEVSRISGTNRVAQPVDMGDDTQLALTIPFGSAYTNSRGRFQTRIYLISRTNLDIVMNTTPTGTCFRSTYIYEREKE